MSLRTLLPSFAPAAILAVTLTAAESAKPTVTYSKDVAPILFKNCAGCHRAGEIAPMSLLNFKETRPWAKSIQQAVVSHAMPPWLADPAYGHLVTTGANKGPSDGSAVRVRARIC